MNNAKIIGLCIGGVLIIGAISSLGNHHSSPELSAPTTTTVFVPSTELTPTADPTAAPSPSDDFLTTVNGEDANISTAAGGDANLLLLAGGVCSDWTGGDDAAGVVSDAIKGIGAQTVTSVSAYQIGEIIGAATNAMCPAYSSQLQAWDAANA